MHVCTVIVPSLVRDAAFVVVCFSTNTTSPWKLEHSGPISGQSNARPTTGSDRDFIRSPEYTVKCITEVGAVVDALHTSGMHASNMACRQ